MSPHFLSPASPSLRCGWRAGWVAFVFASTALAQEQPAPQQPPPSPVPAQAQPTSPVPPAGQPVPPQTPPPPQAGAAPQEVAPPASQRVYSYPAGCGFPDADGVVVPCSGQWVYSDAYGWIWVPGGGAAPYAVEGVPYVYLYTPVYGWSWYISPWGWGPYFYGGWVVHPWLPLGWHAGWVAAPGVFARLGGHAGYRGAPVFHGGGAWHGTVRGGGGHGGGHR